MERYIGLDVHAASCTGVVLSAAGKRLKTFVVETNGAALIEVMHSIAGHKHVCIEEGTQSAWLWEILSRHVEEVVVAGVPRSRGQKTDARDAYGLAEKLRTGTLDRQIFKAPREFALLRELARVHLTVGRDLVRVQARLKNLYRSRGIQTPGQSVYGTTRRDAWMRQLPATARTSAARLYEEYDFLNELKERAEHDLVREAKEHRISAILETCPGMGPIRVARLLPIVVTPHRFRTRQQFWSYCGLGIVMRTSSDWVKAPDGGWIRAQVLQTRGLNREHNHVLKDLFKGAATTVITKLKNDPLHADCDFSGS
jgi:transposase